MMNNRKKNQQNIKKGKINNIIALVVIVLTIVTVSYILNRSDYDYELYINETHGYEIKYPSHWTITTERIYSTHGDVYIEGEEGLLCISIFNLDHVFNINEQISRSFSDRGYENVIRVGNVEFLDYMLPYCRYETMYRYNKHIYDCTIKIIPRSSDVPIDEKIEESIIRSFRLIY